MKPEAELLTYALEKLEAANDEWREAWGQLRYIQAQSEILDRFQGYQYPGTVPEGSPVPLTVGFDHVSAKESERKTIGRLEEAQKQVASWTRTVQHVGKSLFDMYP